MLYRDDGIENCWGSDLQRLADEKKRLMNEEKRLLKEEERRRAAAAIHSMRSYDYLQSNGLLLEKCIWEDIRFTNKSDKNLYYFQVCLRTHKMKLHKLSSGPDNPLIRFLKLEDLTRYTLLQVHVCDFVKNI